MSRFSYTATLVCFLIFALPIQSNAVQLTLDKLSSFTSLSRADSKNGQFRVIVEFNDDIAASGTSNEFGSDNQRTVNKTSKETDRDTEEIC